MLKPATAYTGIILHRHWTIFRRMGDTHAHIAVWTSIKLGLFTLIVGLAVL